MLSDPRDMAHLWDMLDAAKAAVEFTSGLRFEEFVQDRKTRSAVERSLEIVGEAARRVSTGTREDHPDIPWKSIIGLRNVLAHEYGEIRYEVLWTVIGAKMTTLIRQLEDMGVANPPPFEES